METTRKAQVWSSEETGPATLARVMAEVDQQIASGDVRRFRALPTGFEPLDRVLTGGLRPGELLVLGGAFGVGKTILGLQIARNVVHASENDAAMYVCYEHDRTHLMLRLMCLESAEQGYKDALTLGQLADIAVDGHDGPGLMSSLRSTGHYAALLQALDSYAERLVLVKASGDSSTLEHIRGWVEQKANAGYQRLLVVVDYLQKIPVERSALQPETELTTYLTQGLKELALSTGIQVIAIAAADRPGLQSGRIQLSDLRGSSALQYEADVGLTLNNKYDIVSRDHLVYDVRKGETMRNWVVVSVEKNRAGRTGVNMEFALDAAHFHIVPTGRFVRDRLVDGRVVLA
jgi:replicative DNA helicase